MYLSIPVVPRLNVFSLKLFGGAVLEGPDGVVGGKAAHRRRLALLAILAVARRPVGRERLIWLLWGEGAASEKRHLLSEALYVLRKALGENTFATNGDEVALNGAVVQSDVGAFEAALEAGVLEEAATVYRGAFLDGFYVDDAPEFERWAEGERDRLRDAYGQALETLAEREEAAGNPLAAEKWWRKRARHEPDSSRIARRLVRALDAGGERAAALRYADAHARYLRDEMGWDPDDDFVEFVQGLLAEAAAGIEPPVVVPPPKPVVDDLLGEGDPPREKDGGSGTEDRVETGDPSVEKPTTNPQPKPPRWRLPRPKELAYYAGMVALVAGMVLSVLYTRWIETGTAQTVEPRFHPRSIAVLYFDDDSPGGSEAHLAQALTECLIDRLSRVEALEVIPRNGVKPYRAGNVPLDSVVKDLKVGSVVEGSVQRSGNRLRVTVRLVDANTGKELESQTVERPWDEWFALQDAVADEVAGFLRRRLGQEVRLLEQRAGTRSVEALDLYMRAQREHREAEELGAQATPPAVEEALRRLAEADALLARAAAADPRWVEPVSLRGWVALREARVDPGRRSLATFRRAARHADRALALSPRHRGALEARGTARWEMARLDSLPAADNDTLLAGAERDLRAVVMADPSRATAWSTLSQYLRLRGRLPEADDAAQRAWEADAYLEDAEMILERLYRSAYSLASYRSASDWCEEGAKRFSRSWRFRECRLTLMGSDLVDTPNVRGAWHVFDELNQLDPPDQAAAAGRPYNPVYRQMAVARVLARAGLADSARAVVTRARRQVASDPDLPAWLSLSLLYDEAYVCLLLGERQATLALLEEWLRFRGMHGYLARDPQFRALRGDARFDALVGDSLRAARRAPPRGPARLPPTPPCTGSGTAAPAAPRSL